MDEKPFRVNSWWNPVDETRGEVWYNGDKMYDVYINDIKRTSYPVYEVFGEHKSHLLAVGAACALAYRLVMKKEWEG